MKNLFLFCLCLLFSCGRSKIKDKTAAGDSVASYARTSDSIKNTMATEWTGEPESTEKTASSVEIRPAIVTALEAILWSKPSFSDGKEVTRLPRASIINITEQSETLIVRKDTSIQKCDDYGYHFFKVSFQKDGENLTGWIYGSEIHLVDQSILVQASGQPFDWLRFKDSEYDLNAATKDGIGSHDSKGATECEDTCVLFFQLVGSEKIFPVKAEQRAFDKNVTLMRASSNGLLELVQSSIRGFCRVNALNAEMCNGELSIVLTTSQWYPDGRDGKGKVCIQEKNGALIVVKVSEVLSH